MKKLDEKDKFINCGGEKMGRKMKLREKSMVNDYYIIYRQRIEFFQDEMRG